MRNMAGCLCLGFGVGRTPGPGDRGVPRHAAPRAVPCYSKDGMARGVGSPPIPPAPPRVLPPLPAGPPRGCRPPPGFASPGALLGARGPAWGHSWSRRGMVQGSQSGDRRLEPLQKEMGAVGGGGGGGADIWGARAGRGARGAVPLATAPPGAGGPAQPRPRSPPSHDFPQIRLKTGPVPAVSDLFSAGWVLKVCLFGFIYLFSPFWQPEL